MRKCGMRRLLFFAAAASLACTFASRGASVRNAIFNGDFLDGRTGWVMGGLDGTKVIENKNMIANVPECELIFRNTNAKRNVGMFSQYPINVEAGRTYTLSLAASGKGDIRFGVFEYNKQGKNTTFPISDLIKLSPKVKRYTFSYTASTNAATIRPKVTIYAGPPMDVHLHSSFELMLSQEEWAESTGWPEWAVSNKAKNYTGFSKEELRKIREATTVEEILPPYEPISSESTNRFKLTTSEWTFGQDVFPEDIRILGESVLAGKMVFELESSKGVSMLSGGSELLVQHTPQEVSLSRTVTNDDWTLSMKGQLLYDGLIIFDITVKAKEALSIGRASLSIPLRDEQARYIKYSQPVDSVVGIFGFGPIPKAGESVATKLNIGLSNLKNDWNPAVPAEDGGVLWEWNRGGPRFFWIGDEEKGLGWITESDEGWHYDTNDVTWFLERTNDVLFAKVNFITKPLEVNDEWSIRFIMQAMPPKPVRTDWFKMRFNKFWYWPPSEINYIPRIEATMKEDPPLLDKDPIAYVRYMQAWNLGGRGPMRPAWKNLRSRGLKDIGCIWHDLANLGCGSPQIAKPDVMRRYLAAGDYVGFMGLPYLAPTHISMNDLHAYHYAGRNDDWAMLPRRDTSLYLKVCPNSGSSEYLAYSVGKLIDEYGIEGIYFDNCGVEGCSNRGHGCGWEDEDGVTHQSYPYLAMRNFFKMVRYQFVKRGRKPFILMHTGMYPGTVSFADANLEGEGIYGYDYTKMITPGEWRANFIGPNPFGVVKVYLSNMGLKTDTTKYTVGQQINMGTYPLLAMALVHGTPVLNGSVNYSVMAKAWGVLDELTGPKVDFIPYWKWDFNKAPTMNPQGIYASLYCQPDRAVLVMSNFTDTNRYVTIPRSELDRFISGFTHAKDNCFGWGVDLKEATLGMNVTSNNYRMISLW